MSVKPLDRSNVKHRWGTTNIESSGVGSYGGAESVQKLLAAASTNNATGKAKGLVVETCFGNRAEKRWEEIGREKSGIER